MKLKQQLKQPSPSLSQSHEFKPGRGTKTVKERGPWVVPLGLRELRRVS